MMMRIVAACFVVLGMLVLVTPVVRAQPPSDYLLDPPEPRVGDIVRLTLSLYGGARTGSAALIGKQIPGFQTGGLLNVYMGIDLDVKPGSYEIQYEMPSRNGVEKGSVPVRVLAREFATESEVESKYTELDPASQERADREAKELEAIFSQATPQRLWAKAFVPPAAGPPGSPFGTRGVFKDEPKSPHSGIDIKAPEGAEVYASNSGKVVLAKDLVLTGNTVIIDHGLGLYTVYAHLSRMDVHAGEDIERAKLLGLVGATGLATGPHLHWAAKIAGARVDPATLPGQP